MTIFESMNGPNYEKKLVAKDTLLSELNRWLPSAHR